MKMGLILDLGTQEDFEKLFFVGKITLMKMGFSLFM